MFRRHGLKLCHDTSPSTLAKVNLLSVTSPRVLSLHGVPCRHVVLMPPLLELPAFPLAGVIATKVAMTLTEFRLSNL